ncbi:NlmOI [Streptomyces avermitilis]|uniref:NlmOI n=1 Tax=Streptomyces avermitilis TaxID=33903 RepID=UPI0033C13D1E
MSVSEQEAENSAEQEFTRPPAPEKMRDMDFLLGDFRAEWTNFTADPATTGTATWNTASTFHGHAYEMTQRVEAHDLTGRFVVQWVESDSAFSGYYYDDWGNRTLLTSEGWQDGYLAFTGECFGFGKSFLLKEQYEVVDEKHYVKRGFIKFDEGDWIPADEVHCHREA